MTRYFVWFVKYRLNDSLLRISVQHMLEEILAV